MRASTRRAIEARIEADPRAEEICNGYDEDGYIMVWLAPGWAIMDGREPLSSFVCGSVRDYLYYMSQVVRFDQ